MPRPKKPRFVSYDSDFPEYGPMNIPANGENLITVEEMEAIRLSDAEGMDQGAAAELMGVSRQTYGRILARARQTLALSLIHRKRLRVEGGNYEIRGHHGRRRRRRCRSGSGCTKNSEKS